jgi:uncharacterized protein HemX
VSDSQRTTPKSHTLPIALAVAALIGWGSAGYVYLTDRQQQQSLSDQLAQHVKAEGRLTDLNQRLATQQAALDKAAHDLADTDQPGLRIRVEGIPKESRI